MASRRPRNYQASEPPRSGATTSSGAGRPEVHVVSHTHWDREWYLPATRFRQRLVALIDDLIEDPPRNGASFLLDGQMAVAEDYIEVCPERADALRTLLAEGAIEAGPWYVLADELTPGGEALVRNLLAGRRSLARLGATPPPVLYCPDSFGHPASLPTLAAGFGLGLAILSRGFGGARWPAADFTRWVAPDGASVLLYHLSRKGYDIAENLPRDAAAARERWAEIRDDLLGRLTLGVALLPNGADHHARQPELPMALEALRAAASHVTVRASSLTAFAGDAAARAANAALETVRGELRDSYGFMWTLQGTFSSRAHQKRRNAAAERMLVRDAEPWAALARVRGAPDRRHLMNAAWKSLLLCHPHDTLCGCSTDEVARAMDARLDEAEAQAGGIRADSINDLIGHDEDAAREHPGDWEPMTIVRNRAARPRGGVAILRVTSFVSDVRVGANAPPEPPRTAMATTPLLGLVLPQQTLTEHTFTELTQAPRHYPDADIVHVAELAAWIPSVPGYGLACLPHDGVRVTSPHEPPNPARALRRGIGNGRVSISVGPNGNIRFTDLATGSSVPRFIRWESATDRGDLYTASIRGKRLRPVFRGSRIVHGGPVRASIETRWTLAAARERIDMRVAFTVDADAPFVRVTLEGVNTVSDHRLRIGFATGIRDGLAVADAMFGPVERHSIVVPPRDAAMELPPRTAPLHRYVSLFGHKAGATLYSDGLAEYETQEDGVIFVTLLRSVGELSRGDLPERPGHAGWPAPTPEAQCHGPFAAEFAVLPHGARGAATAAVIEHAADDVLLPLTGATLRSALHDPGTIDGIELEGTGLAVSAITTSDNGDWLVLRCVNVAGDATEGTWRLSFPVRDALTARLDETPIGRLDPTPGNGSTIHFTAAPRTVVTILVR
ncbi:MAG: hypothetical protein IT356_02230 [Gemmatimonadaceae bacterium]|nr:hypothetical protein [Gemmatimonadaceae bacterium]